MSDTARALVEQLKTAGEWPEPQLLEDVLAQGDAAIEPLREVVRNDVHGWPEEAPLCFAIDFLGTLQAVDAIPDLVALFRRYDNETLQSAATTLGMLGPAIVEPLLDVVRDRSLDWYPRAEAINALLLAAGGDGPLQDRVAAALRELLADYLARAEELSGEDAELISFLITDIANLADPEARPLITQAFAAKLVDESIIDEEYVDELYRRGREQVEKPEPRAWLDEYKDLYLEEMEARAAEAARPPRDVPEPAAPPYQEPDYDWEEPRPQPIENEGPRIGRNDPCWCGSGKKYKNCHLQSDRG